MNSVVGPEADPPNKRTRRSIVRAWLGQESFWREVTTRTLSAAIVAIGAYLFAVGAGYVRSPSGWQTVKSGLSLVGVYGFSLLFYYFYAIYRAERWAHRPKWLRRTVYVIGWIVTIFGTLTLFDSMAHPLPFWPFTTAPFTSHMRDGRTF